MSGIARWYAKWDNIDEDSDLDELTGRKTDSNSPETQHKSGCLPEEVDAAIASELDKGKRKILSALNLYIAELHHAPRSNPAVQQQLLGALCVSIRDLQEGGEVETLLHNVHEALMHPAVSPQQVEHALGAVALLPPKSKDARVVEVVLTVGVHRLPEFSAMCISHACWVAATLSKSAAAMALLSAAVPIIEKKSRHFNEGDVALCCWAFATAHPLGAQQALRALLSNAKLPASDTQNGRVTAWAIECLGINAVPFFGLPPAEVPSDQAASLHRRLQAVQNQDGVGVLHACEPLLLYVNDLISPAEVQTLLNAANCEWQRFHPVGGPTCDWKSSDVAILETPTSSPLPVLDDIRCRVSQLVGMPDSHLETVQIIRHLHGERYEEQADYFGDQAPSRGMMYLAGQRIVTVLVELSDLHDDDGGETTFPRIRVASRPIKGRALIWTNVGRDGSIVRNAVHASAPIINEKRVKYCLYLWVHAYPLNSRLDQAYRDPMVQESSSHHVESTGPCTDSGVTSRSSVRAPPNICQARTEKQSHSMHERSQLKALGTSSTTLSDFPAVLCPTRPAASPEHVVRSSANEMGWDKLGEDHKEGLHDLPLTSSSQLGLAVRDTCFEVVD